MAVAVVQADSSDGDAANNPAAAAAAAVEGALGDLPDCSVEDAAAASNPAEAAPTPAAAAAAPEAGAAARTQGGAACLRPLPVGQVGEVWVSGAGVAAGYLSQHSVPSGHFAATTPAGAAATAACVGAGSTGGAVGLKAATAAAATSAHSAGRDRFQMAQLQLPPVVHNIQQQQQQQLVSLAVGPGWAVDDVAAEARVWFRMGDLGFMTADGELGEFEGGCYKWLLSPLCSTLCIG